MCSLKAEITSQNYNTNQESIHFNDWFMDGRINLVVSFYKNHASLLR
jgi:hypothetical protein